MTDEPTPDELHSAAQRQPYDWRDDQRSTRAELDAGDEISGHRIYNQPICEEPFSETPFSADQVTSDEESAASGFPIAESSAFWQVDPNSVKAEIFSGSIFLGIVSLGLLVGFGVGWFFFGGDWFYWVAVAAGIVLFLLLTFSTFVWPSIHFRHLHWRLTEQSLEIHRGVIWKHRLSIPLGRVQHADVSQGPVQRIWDLGTLTVHTAGTAIASISLEWLSHAMAVKIRDDLVQQTKNSEST